MRLTVRRPDGTATAVEGDSIDEALDALAVLAPHLPADAVVLEFDCPHPVPNPVEEPTP